MQDEELTLVKPAVEFHAAFLSMVEDYTTTGNRRYQGILDLVQDDFAGYVHRLERWSQGTGLGPGYVPETTFWLVRDGTFIIGTSRLRLQLTPATEREGGHISYDIRPSERGKGYGTLQLALVLEKARELGLRQALVTCDTDNVASARVIEKNGGVFENQMISHSSGKPVSRYWIDLEK